MTDEELLGIANELRCAVGSWPIPYLGIKVGGRLNEVEAWKDTVEKVRGRLNRWEVGSLSMGGRITLIKSVLTALPIYNLAFSRLPKTVEKMIKSLFCNFLWGGARRDIIGQLGLGGIIFVTQWKEEGWELRTWVDLILLS